MSEQVLDRKPVTDEMLTFYLINRTDQSSK